MKERLVLDAEAFLLYFAGSREVKEYIEKAYLSTAEVYACEINLAGSCTTTLGYPLGKRQW